MPTSENRVLSRAGIQKRGGYSGGMPASKVNPPVKVPSGVLKPSANGANGSSPQK